MSTILTASELLALQKKVPALPFLDVRLPEDYAVSHIPGAASHCVFEVGFLQEVEKAGFDRSAPLCVYGARETSHESRIAAEKLERAGFTQVHDFQGGLEAWLAAELPLELGDPAPAEQVIRDGTHALDLAESTIIWVGRNLINKHWGRVAPSQGSITFLDGQLVSGAMTLDMHRMSSADLAGSDLHDVLIHHLESDDFFDVAHFPEARFTFDKAEVCSSSPGCRNLRLPGELTLRGVTRPLVIEGAAGLTPEGRAALQAAFTLDRTDWGAIYGSGRFFRRLAGHLVNDEVELQVRLLTQAPVTV